MISDREKDIFNRSIRLVGNDAMRALSEVRVIIFGIGGVGSWTAEGLVRSGVKHLTIVDADRVCITNINRQLEATCSTVGEVKVDALKRRLLEINPEAEITAIQDIFCEQNQERFKLDDFDYIVDAIDSLKDKIALIMSACRTEATFFSSMGAALKLDPTAVRVAEFWNVRGCPLGAILRKKIKRSGVFPAKKFLCVYDEEVLPNRDDEAGDVSGAMPTSFHKAQINGSAVHITAIFGMTICGLLVQDVYRKSLEKV